MLKLMTSGGSGWRIFTTCVNDFDVIQVWFVVRYICLWPGVSFMILTLFQCDSDMAQNCDFGVGQSCDFCVFRFCCVVWIYVLTKCQNHIKTMSKPYPKPWYRIPYQNNARNHIKIISRPKASRNGPKVLPTVSFFHANSPGIPEKSLHS